MRAMERREVIDLLLNARKKAHEGPDGVRLSRAPHLHWRAMLRPDVFEALKRDLVATGMGVSMWRSHDEAYLNELAESLLLTDAIHAYGFQIGRDPNSVEPVQVSIEQRPGKLVRVQFWRCSSCISIVETRTPGEWLTSALCPNCKSALRQLQDENSRLVVEW
jgi:hypothetical protein